MVRSSPQPTTDVDGSARPARGLWLRRIFIVLMALLVAAALSGLLGVRGRTTSATTPDGSVALEVRYAQVARAGLDVPLDVVVRRTGPTDQPVTIAISSDYLALFNRSGIDPEPSASSADDETLVLHFDDAGPTLAVSFDAQVQHGRHFGRRGRVVVLDAAGRPLVAVGIRTWLTP